MTTTFSGRSAARRSPADSTPTVSVSSADRAQILISFPLPSGGVGTVLCGIAPTRLLDRPAAVRYVGGCPRVREACAMSLQSRWSFPLVAAITLAGTADRAPAQTADAGWKAGVATVAITPDGPIWMAGYANRTKPSEGTAQDLFAKALALEDAGGSRLVIVTMDLVGIPRSLRDAVAKQADD